MTQADLKKMETIYKELNKSYDDAKLLTAQAQNIIASLTLIELQQQKLIKLMEPLMISTSIEVRKSRTRTKAR